MLRVPSIHLFADLRQLLYIGTEGHVHMREEVHVCGGFLTDLVFNVRVVAAP